jgi:hypothetical protein
MYLLLFFKFNLPVISLSCNSMLFPLPVMLASWHCFLYTCYTKQRKWIFQGDSNNRILPRGRYTQLHENTSHMHVRALNKILNSSHSGTIVLYISPQHPKTGMFVLIQGLTLSSHFSLQMDPAQEASLQKFCMFLAPLMHIIFPPYLKFIHFICTLNML